LTEGSSWEPAGAIPNTSRWSSFTAAFIAPFAKSTYGSSKSN
jgi:hypothetical protein